jgi:hypothetical protein
VTPGDPGGPAEVEDAEGLLVGREQLLHPLSQREVARAGLVQEGPPFGGGRPLQGGVEERFLNHRRDSESPGRPDSQGASRVTAGRSMRTGRPRDYQCQTLSTESPVALL